MYVGDDFDADSCEACSLPSDDTEGYVVIVFEISCSLCFSPDGSLSPVEVSNSVNDGECFDGVRLVDKDVGQAPLCEYLSLPFTVEEFDDGYADEVRVSFTNNWSSGLDEVVLFYDRGDGSGKQYHSLNFLARGAVFPNTFALACDASSQTAVVEVFICNDSISHSVVPSGCGDTNLGSCSYIYEIPCSADIICGGRRLEGKSDGVLGVDGSLNIEQGFMTEEMKAAGEPNSESEDTPYCLHDNHPCKGDEARMVHVCHYSSRSGFQTFCIPEMDSDILRFNNNHHCGPCDGWNGVESTDQLM